MVNLKKNRGKSRGSSGSGDAEMIDLRAIRQGGVGGGGGGSSPGVWPAARTPPVTPSNSILERSPDKGNTNEVGKPMQASTYIRKPRELREQAKARDEAAAMDPVNAPVQVRRGDEELRGGGASRLLCRGRVVACDVLCARCRVYCRA